MSGHLPGAEGRNDPVEEVREGESLGFRHGGITGSIILCWGFVWSSAEFCILRKGWEKGINPLPAPRAPGTVQGKVTKGNSGAHSSTRKRGNYSPQLPLLSKAAGSGWGKTSTSSAEGFGRSRRNLEWEERPRKSCL